MRNNGGLCLNSQGKESENGSIRIWRTTNRSEKWIGSEMGGIKEETG